MRNDMTHSLVITTDTDQPNKVNGFVNYLAYGDDFPVVGTRESGKWTLRAGISDEYRAEGTSLRATARRLAKEIGIIEGTIAIGSGAFGEDKVYDVRTGREVKESAREVDPSPAPRLSLPFEPSYYPNTDGGTDIRDGNGEIQGWTVRTTHGSFRGYRANGELIATPLTDAEAIHIILCELGTPIEYEVTVPASEPRKSNLRPMTPDRVARREARAERVAARGPIPEIDPMLDTDDLAIDSAGESHMWDESQESARELVLPLYPNDKGGTDVRNGKGEVMGHTWYTDAMGFVASVEFESIGTYETDEEAVHAVLACLATAAEATENAPQKSANDDAPTYWYH